MPTIHFIKKIKKRTKTRGKIDTKPRDAIKNLFKLNQIIFQLKCNQRPKVTLKKKFLSKLFENLKEKIFKKVLEIFFFFEFRVMKR